MLLKVVASLVYADDEAPVEKPVDDEAPLLTNYDGIEYASSDRPSKVISGRASFKLKISQVPYWIVVFLLLTHAIQSVQKLSVDCNLELENTCFGRRYINSGNT